MLRRVCDGILKKNTRNAGLRAILELYETIRTEAFRVRTSTHQPRGDFKRSWVNRVRRIAARLRARAWSPQDRPLLAAGNIQ